jgi:hypothetical protein
LNTKNLLLTILLVVGLCAAAVSFKARFHSEARNRAVELVIDWPDAQALANTSSQAIEGVLTQLHAAGITTVAVTEETLETLHGSGIVNYKRIGDNTELTFTEGFTGQEQRVIDALNHKTKLHITPQGPHQYLVDAPWPQFNGTPIGLDGDVVKTITSLKDAQGHPVRLLVAPRLYNFTGVNDDNIRWELAQTKDLIGPDHLGPFIFAGAAVLGNRSHITDAVHAFQDLGLTYGSVEFAKTLGDEDFSRAAAANAVRVHSIGLDEMGTMEEPTAIERFVRAAKERNIRVCYVRLFTNGLAKDPDALHANVDFIQKIVAGMTEARLSVQGPAHPFGDPDPVPGRILRILMSLGIAAGIVMLILAFTGSENRAFWPILITAVILAAVLAIPSTSTKGREILALLAACTFPTLALCGRPIRALSGPLVSTGEAMLNAVREYVRITLVTFAGVVFVVGLLSGRLFFLKVDEFLGVKAVLLVPVILVAAFYFLGLADLDRSENWATRKRVLLQRLGAMSGHKLAVGQIFLGIVVLAGLVLLAARSGNDPGVGVSPAELKMRALLDKYLLVRPRTKEFLLGHPAMFIGLAFAFSRIRLPKWVLPSLLVLGAIGQSSLLDTFCHLHTPLYLSLLRATIGWALGGFIGAILYAIVARYFRRPGAMPIALDGHDDTVQPLSKQETLA